MKVHMIDSTVFCNLLSVPFMSDEREYTLSELKEITSHSGKEIIILPYATIIETGNHIAHISDGNKRYQSAEHFQDAIRKTINNEAPWYYYGSQLTKNDLSIIAERFPEVALKYEMGVGDLSIIRAYEKYRDETPAISEIRIWSYDKHLEKYHEVVKERRRRR